jgi:hypothetical protein
MKIDEKIRQRFSDLLLLGEKVLQTKTPPPAMVIGDDRIDLQLANQWVTSILHLLGIVFGRDSVHYSQVSKKNSEYLGFTEVYEINGILMAARDDYESDQLYSVKTAITADVFLDFYEQANYLLTNGYYQAAAVVLGAILEDALKKLCLKSGINPIGLKMDRMNAELAKKGIYSGLVQKQITANVDLRNKAAHGEWDKFGIDDVRSFYAWILPFLGNYIS